MGTVIMVITIIAAILMILIVMVQNPKGGGLDSSFGNVNQLGGVAKSTETIEKTTWTLAGIIAVLSIITAMNLGTNTPPENSNIEATSTAVQNPLNTTPSPGTGPKN